jgi:thiol-disulfide isomerase/thioredoxin
MSAITLAALLALAAPSDAVLVQFTSTQCPHCRTMEPVVSQLVSTGYPIQKVDVDRHRSAAVEMKVRGVPTFVYMVGNREVARVEGPASFEKLAGMFGDGRSTPPLNSLLANSPPASSPPTADLRTSNEATFANPAQTAFEATVRLTVEDDTGRGYGTGTIIDAHEDEALVVTCGHLFRESQGKGRITIKLFAPGAPGEVEGHLLAYDLHRDIALVSMRPGIAVRPVRVAPNGDQIAAGAPAFTLGCDKGADATVRETRITAVDKYHGRPNITSSGEPVDGRSGGGLFTADGLLIGICNAADPQDQEGIYAGLASIHWQLDEIGQSSLYRQADREVGLVLPGAGQQSTENSFAGTPQLDSIPELPRSMPGGNSSLGGAPRLMATPSGVPVRNVSNGTVSNGTGGGPLGADAELVVIIRSKQNPQERSEIYVVDQASPQLMAEIVAAAREGARQRSAPASAQQGMEDPRFAQLPQGQLPQYGGQPIVRGQSAE